MLHLPTHVNLACAPCGLSAAVLGDSSRCCWCRLQKWVALESQLGSERIVSRLGTVSRSVFECCCKENVAISRAWSQTLSSSSKLTFFCCTSVMSAPPHRECDPATPSTGKSTPAQTRPVRIVQSSAYICRCLQKRILRPFPCA